MSNNDCVSIQTACNVIQSKLHLIRICSLWVPWISESSNTGEVNNSGGGHFAQRIFFSTRWRTIHADPSGDCWPVNCIALPGHLCFGGFNRFFNFFLLLLQLFWRAKHGEAPALKISNVKLDWKDGRMEGWKDGRMEAVPGASSPYFIIDAER